MKTNATNFQATARLQGKSLLAWRSAQLVLLAVGLCIFLALIFFPDIGHHALWNVLISAAPLLFVLIPGIWRNICPLATVAMLPHHLNLSRKKRLPVKWLGRLDLAGVALLFLIVPVRHVLLDSDPQATAVTLALLGAAALASGVLFDSKSAWCSSLCPVYPVEKLYGQRPLVTVANAHCAQCRNCVNPCPDSTPGTNLATGSQSKPRRMAASLLVGGLPGFIWGWFHVRDYGSAAGLREWLIAFGLPWGTLLLSLAAFLLLRGGLGEKREPHLVRMSAAAAVSCYYWYRLPAMIGFGLFPEQGTLVDLTHLVPAWSVMLVQAAVVAFFGWWLVLRKPAPAVWALRPPFAVGPKAVAVSVPARRNESLDQPASCFTHASEDESARRPVLS